MKKAWSDIKSFVTVATTFAYIILTFLGKIDGNDFSELFSMIIIFYFGTQFQKAVDAKEVKKK